jgi:phage terminase large subunit-like protein
MEANFMQDIILDEFDAEGRIRGYQLPILPDKRTKPEKVQRIEAVSPLWERGYVFYNEALRDSPDMQVGIEQTLALERGSRVHDDAPDADEGAIWYLQRHTRQNEFKPVAIPRRPPRGSW